MPRRSDTNHARWPRLRHYRRELGITLVLIGIAVAAAAVEYGSDMGIATLAVILGFGLHVRLFLGVLVAIGNLRSGLPVREIAICTGFATGALLLHWLSPVPLGRVAALSALIALLVFFAIRVLPRMGG